MQCKAPDWPLTGRPGLSCVLYPATRNPVVETLPLCRPLCDAKRMDSTDTDILLKRREVEKRVGLSRSTIYVAMAERQFPRPRLLGPRQARWSLAEIERWIESQPRSTSGMTTP